MAKYVKYKDIYRITLYGRNDANRLANGNSTVGSTRAEQIAAVATTYIPNKNSPNVNSKIYRFNLNYNFNILAKGSKVILIYARIPSLTNSSLHRTIRLCGAESSNSWDSERGLNGNPILCIYGEAGNTATDVNYFNTDPTMSGIEVPSNFLTKGYIEIELCTLALIGSINFVENEINDLCLQFIIYEPDEELTQDPNLAPEVNTKSLRYATRPPKINH